MAWGAAHASPPSGKCARARGNAPWPAGVGRGAGRGNMVHDAMDVDIEVSYKYRRRARDSYLHTSPWLSRERLKGSQPSSRSRPA